MRLEPSVGQPQSSSVPLPFVGDTPITLVHEHVLVLLWFPCGGLVLWLKHVSLTKERSHSFEATRLKLAPPSTLSFALTRVRCVFCSSRFFQRGGSACMHRGMDCARATPSVRLHEHDDSRDPD